MADCNSEFRMFWLNSKIQETDAGSQSRVNPNVFVAAPCFNGDSAGIQQAYSTPLSYKRDGLLFLMKETQYEPGSAATVLLWKVRAAASEAAELFELQDTVCSEYVLEAHNKEHPEQQVATLLLLPDGSLVPRTPVPHTVQTHGWICR